MMSSQSGFGLFTILIAAVLFAALSYAITNMGNGAKSLSDEKVRVVAAEIIDQGNRLTDAAGRLRLRRIPDTQISFQNAAVVGYTNLNCSSEACKIFSFEGGGLDWETPPPNSNGGQNWGYSADLAISNIGSDAADLIAVLPNINSDVCARVNITLGIHTSAVSPPVIPAVTVNKFIGTYNPGPAILSSALLVGQKSGCLQATTLAGSAVSAGMNIYVYYQVLLAR